jgi:phosphoserine phosphatase
MIKDRNRTSVLRHLAALQQMSLTELQEKWRDLYGSEPPNYGKQSMMRQLAYRVQELFYGGLSKGVKEQLKQAADAEDSKGKKRKSPFTIGTRFVRVWQNQEHEVVVVSGGFEYQGQKFSSLTAVAGKITGSHWNGRAFFGLRGKDKQSVANS